MFAGEFLDHDSTGVKYKEGTPEYKKIGQKLCGGEYFAILWLLSGDLEYDCKELLLEYYNSGDPCFYCNCGDESTGIPWKDLRLGAEWTKQLYGNHEQWLESHPHPHSVFLLEWITILSVLVDIMHVKHLGVDMNLAGSVLWMLCFGGILGGCL